MLATAMLAALLADKFALLILLLAVIVGATVAGHLSGRYHARSERWIKPMLNVAMVGCIPVISLLSVWPLDLQATLLVLPIAFIVLTAMWVGLGEVVARWHRLDRPDHGTYLMAAGLTNCGFTMAAFLCYVLLEPGEQALGMATMFLLPWTFVMFGIMFPLGGRFGPNPPPITVRGWLREVFSLRSLGIVGTLIGLMLNLGEPQLNIRWLHDDYLVYLKEPVMILINAVFYFSIGHALTLHDSGRHWKLHVSLAMLKFLISPALVVGLLVVITILGLQLPQPAAGVLIIQAVAPTAVLGTVISRLMGLSVRLASLLFVINTIVFLVIVLPPLIWLLPWLQGVVG